ncbi:MAG: hypothetical protein MJZ32_11640 [Bacteroidaceae bacterium]|nr:hypothetical protein [Bacteroidaceae bacterium]
MGAYQHLMPCFHFVLMNASIQRPNRKHNITFVPKALILFKAINKKNSSNDALVGNDAPWRR